MFDEHILGFALEILLQPQQHLGELVAAQQLLNLSDGGLFDVSIDGTALLRFENWRLLFGDFGLRWSAFFFDFGRHRRLTEGFLNRELSNVSLLLLQQLLPLGLREKLRLASNSYLMGIHGAAEYLPLEFEVGLVPDIGDEAVPLEFVLPQHIVSVALVEHLAHLALDEGDQLLQKAVGVLGE